MSAGPSAAQVVAVAARDGHHFSKTLQPAIRLLAGQGVEGDAHSGTTVKHRSRVARDASQPNLRQVHLLHAELFDFLAGKGFTVEPGDIGENVTTRGLDLLALPTGTKLQLGGQARVELTGLRNPCAQLDAFQKGLTKAVLDRADDGSLIRLAGVMAIVLASGDVRAGDPIAIELPAGVQKALEPV